MPAGDRQSGQDLRCHCHRLVAVIDGSDVRLKCPRCKRVMILKTRGVISVHFEQEAQISVNALETGTDA